MIESSLLSKAFKKKKKPKIQGGDPVGDSSHPTLEKAEQKRQIELTESL